ncbi:MAG: cation-efflux pump [Chloroflexi bacterium]|nr:cation-efflux pump [Chloroflexota bacterium]
MQEKTLVAASSVLAAIGLTTIKIVVGVLTGSLGILSEAAHSGLDLVAAAVTLVAVRVAERPADHNHPYGHGKIENLSALIEAGLLIVTCVAIIYEAIQRLFFRPVEVEASLWAFVILAISIVVDFSRSRALARAAQKYQSQALEADALHFSTDIASSAVVLVGLGLVKAGQLSGLHWLASADAVAALGVALISIVISLQLTRRAVDVLLDTAPSHLADEIRKQALVVDGVVDAGQVRVRRVGPQSFVDMHIAVGRAATLEESHRIASAVEQVVKNAVPRADVLVHVDPVAPQDENLMDTLRGLAAQHELQLHSIRLQNIGGPMYIQFHVEVPDSLTLEEAHALVSHLEDEARRLIPHVAEVTSHIEPVQRHGGHDELPDTALEAARQDVERIARETCGPDGFHHVRVRSVDGELAILLHVFFDDRSPIGEAHDLATRLETTLRRKISNVGQVLVHVEPRSMAVSD